VGLELGPETLGQDQLTPQPALGLVAFAVATVAALIAQTSTMLALPRSAAR
jgi:hypothetical protein